MTPEQNPEQIDERNDTKVKEQSSFLANKKMLGGFGFIVVLIIGFVVLTGYFTSPTKTVTTQSKNLDSKQDSDSGDDKSIQSYKKPQIEDSQQKQLDKCLLGDNCKNTDFNQNSTNNSNKTNQNNNDSQDTQNTSGTEDDSTDIKVSRINKSTADFFISSSKGDNGVSTSDGGTEPAVSGKNISQSLFENNNGVDNGVDDSGKSQYADIFKAPAFNSTKAKFNKINPNLLLSQGTYIPCILRSKIISNISGQISCTISENVYSANGNVLLIEKGSTVTGFYQGANVQHGSNQLFAVWDKIQTTNNIEIPLLSGSTSPLGVSGISGYSDTHFWLRFKNAILLSILQDTAGAITGGISKNQGYDYTANTRDSTVSLAQSVLQQMGDIKPTIYKSQGDKIAIFVARNIDFSNVYKLKLKHKKK